MAEIMRLLNTTTFQVRKVSDIDAYQDTFDKPPYAILSHRWLPDEITFSTPQPIALQHPPDPQDPSAESKLKIRGSCQLAKSQGIEWLWIDTLCINKSDAVELEQSLNSMFRWYSEAKLCYVYLSDVLWSGSRGPGMFHRQDQSQLASEWFERGWTLQELIAPRHLVFYDKNWKEMGTKSELAEYLQNHTSISAPVLTGHTSLDQVCVSSKMSWMAGRTTQYVEDIAYSLLGILGITLKPIYGEGTAAFLRLQDTLLLSHSFDESLFAWKSPASGELKCFERRKKSKTGVLTKPCKWNPPDRRWGLLAPSPDCFAGVNAIVHRKRVVRRLEGGFKRTGQGVHIQLPFMETKVAWAVFRKEMALPLNCWSTDTDLNIVLQLWRPSRSSPIWSREQIDTLKSKGTRVGTNTFSGVDQLVTGGVTIDQPAIAKDV